MCLEFHRSLYQKQEVMPSLHEQHAPSTAKDHSVPVQSRENRENPRPPNNGGTRGARGRHRAPLDMVRRELSSGPSQMSYKDVDRTAGLNVDQPGHGALVTSPGAKRRTNFEQNMRREPITGIKAGDIHTTSPEVLRKRDHGDLS